MDNASKAQKMNRHINFEKNVMRYYSMQSLQHISAVNIISALWRQADIQHYVKSFNHCGHDDLPRNSMLEMRRKIAEKLLDGISQLPVTNSERKILSNIVEPIGLEIYNWIINHDKNIFSDYHTWHLYQKPKAINFMDDLAWTSRGRIDCKRTAKNILENEQLSNYYRYNLACNYCLEDDIAIIAPKVIDTFFLGPLKKNAMLYFWTSHITGDFTELDKAVYSYNMQNRTDCTTNECIFQVLIGDIANEVGIKHIWGKLSDVEKSRQCVPAIKQSSSIDIHCFLLSEMNEEQQQGAFQTCALKILSSLLGNWLWDKYFLPTLHHIWNVIDELSFIFILECIVDKMEENHKDIEKYDHYRDTFKESWQGAPEHLKESVFERDNGNRGRTIFFMLLCDKNVDIIQSMLLYSNYAQKKNILFSDNCLDKCCLIIKNDRWDLLEMLIEHTLLPGDDVDRFKKKFLKVKGEFIVLNLMQSKEWNKLEQLEKWAFKSDDEIYKFRRGLTYSEICRDIFKSIAARNKDFTDLEIFFKWCTSGEEESVVRLKAEIPRLHFAEVICKIIEDKYDFLEKFLKWCFVNDQTKIDQFKQNICYDHKSFEIVALVVDLIEQDDHLQSLENFARWCFTNEQEINKFKGWILHLQDTEGVCTKLLRQIFFKLADDFIDWCCNSSHIKIDNFKNQLMCYDYLDSVFRKYKYDNETLKQIFIFFNPSNETVVKFKGKYMSFEWFENILMALNNYVLDHNVSRT